MPDIVVSENIEGKAIDELRRGFDVAFEPDLWKDPSRLSALLTDARALIVRNQTCVTADLIGHGGALQIIARAGAGLDNIDVAAAAEAGLIISSAPYQNALSVAELTIGFMLALARKIPAADESTKSGHWDRHQYVGIELSGRTLGVAGFGKIGGLVASRARGLGMRVLAFDPYVAPDALNVVESGVDLVDFDTLLTTSDVISCHLPATAETRNLFNAAGFHKIKPGCLFLNMARGDIVDEASLIVALESGRVAGAALDVRQTEPPQHGPLEKMNQVILTPHIAAFTHEAQERVTAAVCHDVAAVLNGRPARNAVAHNVSPVSQPTT